MEALQASDPSAIVELVARELDAMHAQVLAHDPARAGGRSLQRKLLARIDGLRAEVAGFREAAVRGFAAGPLDGVDAVALANRLLDHATALEVRLRGELAAMAASLADAQRQLQEQRGARDLEREAVLAELDAARHAAAAAEERSATVSAGAQGTIEELGDLKRRVAQGERLLGTPQEQVMAARRDSGALAGMSASIPFQLGYLLTRVARQPWRIAGHARSLLRLVRGAYRRVRARRAGEARAPADVVGVRLPGEWQAALDDNQRRAALADRQVALTALATPARKASGVARPASVAGARIAIIADEFTRSDFARHCSLLALERGKWRAGMAAFKPHLLLVESAWHGNDGQWTGHVETASADLQEVLAYCAAQGIPSVFWNKEDPVHFDHFLRTAALFDYVATTDLDRIAAYREQLRHDRIFLLPFGVDPHARSPVETGPRLEACSFAGSWYPQHPERNDLLRMLCEVVGEHVPVEIYDRNARPGTGGDFPPALRELVVGSLPYGEIDLAYKGYRHAITVNSSPDSQSMVARRVFDLLASGTFVVSNYSRAMRLLFGDLVISSDDPARVRARWRALHRDPVFAEKVRLLALRKVMSEHTVEHRLGHLLDKVFGPGHAVAAPHVTVVARARDQAELDAVQASFRRQAHPSRQLDVVLVDGFRPAPGSVDPETAIHSESQASADPLAAGIPAGAVACFSPRDYYGPDYLGDLANGLRYAAGAAVGKDARHRMADGAVSVVEGASFRPVESLRLRRALVPLEQLHHASLAHLARSIEDGAIAGERLVALDAYSYCEDARGEAVPEVDFDDAIDRGLSMEALDRAANRALADATSADDGLPRLEVLFPRATHAHGHVAVSHDRGISISSTQDPGDWSYVYAVESFRANQVVYRDKFRFQLAARGRLSARLIVIFSDEHHERLGTVQAAFNAPQRIEVPRHCRWVRLAIRVTGPGRLDLSRLVLGTGLRRRTPEAPVLARSPRLLVGKGYPSRSRLYHYSFIHRRVLAYREHGVEHEVFRWNPGKLAFDEFEGVDVVAGGSEQLAGMLQGKRFESIEVHPLYPEMWGVIREHLRHTRVNLWVHGAEIQPWYRRAFNYPAGPMRDRAVRATAARTAMWREIFRLRHPNLHLVFVSRYLARQAMADVGADLQPWQYSIVHNFIDGDFFTYEEKDAAQRHRILSIRPYNSPVYANDLSVKAVLDLAREPWFDELRFLFVGDGELFDETLAPLRGLANVEIRKGFLAQSEIARLHKDYGVFLVPSRMDSQGVSRDEAMSSGLVPLTNAVAAIPEFVAPGAGVLAPAEDWRALAQAIRELHADPDRFRSMSAAAARCARAKSGFDETIAKEIALIRDGDRPAALDGGGTAVRGTRRFAVYGDLNLNITDGSAVWAASLVQVLAGLDDAEVTLFLKAPVTALHIIEPLLSLDNVRLVEPSAEEGQARSVDDALDAIAEHDRARPFDAIVLRGFDLCTAATTYEQFSQRLWVYITDLPQDAEGLDEDARERIGAIVAHAAVVLCQTPQFETHMLDAFPQAAGRTAILPPMIPMASPAPPEDHGNGPLRLVYAGKFAPLWGIREMLDAFARLRIRHPDVELHVYGDKIHHVPDEPGFREEIADRLAGTPGLVWHREVSREQLYAELPGFDVGWAWRQAALEAGTHELSTKVLEYAACGLPTIVYPNAVNRSVLGDDYPLYARDEHEALAVIEAMLADRGALGALRGQLAQVAERFMFDAVRARYVQPLADAIRNEETP